MKTYYLFDPQTVARVENAALTFGTVEKSTTEQFWVDAYSRTEGSPIPDWEHQVSIAYPYVLYEENAVGVDGVTPAPYKMWYFAKAVKNPVTSYHWLQYLIDKDNSRNVVLGDFQNTARGTVRTPDSALCYMESEDGIRWRRPDCGEFYYKKQDGTVVGTNILFVGEHGAGVHKNTHPAAGKTEPLFLFACGMNGVGVSWSEDGIHWREPIRVLDIKQDTYYMPGDTHNQLFWSPELSRYVMITRGFEEDIRLVVTLATTDAVTSIRDVAKAPENATEEERFAWARSCFSETIPALVGRLACQPYSMPITRLGENGYVGVVSMLNFDRKTDDLYRVYASLAWSRDGVFWQYLCNKAPFIANADTFELKRGNDYGMIYTANPVRVGDQIKIFYAAIPEMHYFHYDQIPSHVREIVDREIPKAAAARAITRTTALNVATLKVDRYAGYHSQNGTVITRPFTVADGIALTADIAPGGTLSAALLDENGAVIPGFDHTDFTPVNGSATDTALAWNGNIAALRDRAVSLEIRLQNAAVYTITV